MFGAIEIWVREPLDGASLRDTVASTPGVRVAHDKAQELRVTRGILRRPSFSIRGPEAVDFADRYPHLVITGLAAAHRYVLSRDEGTPVDDEIAADVADRVAMSADGFIVDTRTGVIVPPPRVTHNGVEMPARRSTWSPEVLEALRGVPRLSVVFSETQLARSLWEFGEDALAERALTLTRAEMLAIRRITAVFYDPDYPLPITGQHISKGHATAMAGIAFFEGGIRPLARTRRRPQKQRPERFTPVPAPPSDSIGEPDWY